MDNAKSVLLTEEDSPRCVGILNRSVKLISRPAFVFPESSIRTSVQDKTAENLQPGEQNGGSLGAQSGRSGSQRIFHETIPRLLDAFEVVLDSRTQPWPRLLWLWVNQVPLLEHLNMIRHDCEPDLASGVGNAERLERASPN
jgi:hypothetical protein